MDRQSTLGFVLIFILIMVWMWMYSPTPKPPQQRNEKIGHTVDTVRIPLEPKVPEQSAAEEGPKQVSRFFAGRTQGRESVVTVETDKFVAELSSRGGTIKSWTLKNFKTWDGKPVQLVDYDKQGDLSLLFTSSDGRLVDTHDLYFDTDGGPGTVRLDEKHFEFEINFRLPVSTGGAIVKTYHFRTGDYGCDIQYQFVGVDNVIANYEYQLVWESGLRYAEVNSIDESSFAEAYAYAGKELTELDAKEIGQKVQKDISGTVDWVAARNKYFALALIPTQPNADGAYIEGTRTAKPNNGVQESYSIALKMPFRGGNETSKFSVFLGPLDLDIVKHYGVGLEAIMSLGWTWLIRPIARYIMLPLFNVIHLVIPNWGIVIIVFSVIIKVVLHPLTRSQMKSMKKMQALQPLMDELREKYKDDPQKMNQAIMNLYKEYGVNPAGGCLPLLLQMPILYALWALFRANIELRQAHFVGWITDLSRPDVAFTLPFRLPIVGIDEVSGIALIMGVTMFVQQKMSVKDPRQQAMIWMMPIMMTLLFNSFPAGLNLYYTVFNVLGIGQQIIINKQHAAEPLRKVEPKKRSQGGLFGRFKNIPRLKK